MEPHGAVRLKQRRNMPETLYLIDLADIESLYVACPAADCGYSGVFPIEGKHAVTICPNCRGTFPGAAAEILRQALLAARLPHFKVSFALRQRGWFPPLPGSN